MHSALIINIRMNAYTRAFSLKLYALFSVHFHRSDWIVSCRSSSQWLYRFLYIPITVTELFSAHLNHNDCTTVFYTSPSQWLNCFLHITITVTAMFHRLTSPESTTHCTLKRPRTLFDETFTQSALLAWIDVFFFFLSLEYVQATPSGPI